MVVIKPKVSDHALMRYLERIIGIDIDSIRKGILTPEVVSSIKSGAKKIRSNGFVFLIKDGTIATILKHKMSNNITQNVSRETSDE